MHKTTSIAAAAALALGCSVAAQPGSLIKNVNLPVPGTGVSVAVDCQVPANIYYTHIPGAMLHKMDANGTALGSVPIADTASGRAVEIDEMSFDFTRGAGGVLWGCEHGSNPVAVWTIDPATGNATLAFTSQTNSIGTFRDGLAFDSGADVNDPTDDSIYISGDISTTVEEYKTDGTLIRQLTPLSASGTPLGSISGIMVGKGDLLYLGRNGAVQIVQVRKSDGVFIGSFASPGGARDEGLECDPINFAPKLALWSREFNSPGFMSVIELEPDTCTCGGAQNVPPQFTQPLCGSAIPCGIGTPVTFNVTVVDADPGDTITLSQSGAPAGATFTPSLPVSGSSPVSSTFSWVPTGPGMQVITFSATDGTNTVTCKVTLDCFEMCFWLLGTRTITFPLPWSPEDVIYLDPLHSARVTMTNIPKFKIPNDGSLQGAHIYSQVYMDNAINFPKDPYKVSSGLDIVLGSGASTYGNATGISIWLAQPPALGGELEIAFKIN